MHNLLHLKRFTLTFSAGIPMQQNFMRLFVLLVSLVLVPGCSYFQKEKEDYESESAEELYRNAQESMADKNWETAVERLRLLEAKYPYGVYAEQARIDTIYAYYRTEQTGLAIASADRFIKLHPTHEKVDYAYYLKGLASFTEDNSILGTLAGEDDLSDRDASNIRAAMAAFEELFTLFPESQYVPDAQRRFDYLLEALAKNELAVANYYYSRGAYVAVVNRAKGIVEQFASTPQVEQALAMMMFSYQHMSLDDLAKDARRVLELNFPQSSYLELPMETAAFTNKYSANKDAAKKKPGWFSNVLGRFKKDKPSG